MIVDEHDLCDECGVRPVVYDSPKYLCEECWVDWWVSGFAPKDQKEVRKDVEEYLKKIKG